MNNGYIKKCWRCHSDKQENWCYCPQCGALLSSNRNDILPDKQLDIAFLNDILFYGWHNHYSAALVLYNSIIDIDNIYNKCKFSIDIPRIQTISMAKIFVEYIALLEAFGVLCISIMKRDKASIRCSYINTEPSEVSQFYNRVISIKRVKLEQLLNLPSTKVMEKAACNIGASYDIDKIITSFKTIAGNIKNIAKQYTAKRYMLVRNYNKLKHCFPVIEGNWAGPTDNSKISILSHDSIGYLSTKQSDVYLQLNNIENITIMGAELISMCIILHKINNLYID